MWPFNPWVPSHANLAQTEIRDQRLSQKSSVLFRFCQEMYGNRGRPKAGSHALEGWPGPQGCHKYSWFWAMGGAGGANRVLKEKPQLRCGQRVLVWGLGWEGCPIFADGDHPAGALGFPAAPSAPGVISPICEVFLRPARKTSGYWILAQRHVQKIFCL